MGKVISFEPRVGKAQMGQTSGGFTVIIPKTNVEVCPQIENKVQEPSSQLSWNFSRVQFGAYKSSYVDEYFHIHNIPNWKESTLLLLVVHKSFDRYYIIGLIR